MCVGRIERTGGVADTEIIDTKEPGMVQSGRDRGKVCPHGTFVGSGLAGGWDPAAAAEVVCH